MHYHAVSDAVERFRLPVNLGNVRLVLLTSSNLLGLLAAVQL